jgi:hypothetical protein
MTKLCIVSLRIQIVSRDIGARVALLDEVVSPSINAEVICSMMEL